MTDLGIQEKALDTLTIMNSAIVNLHLYPPTNAMIIKNIDRLYETFTVLLADEISIIFAESDRNLLLSGEPLSQKQLGKPQVAIFLMLMINWGIKSLTFKKGLKKSELIPFLQTMAKKPEEVKPKGGFEQVIAEGIIPHILINQKISIAKDQDRHIVLKKTGSRIIHNLDAGILDESIAKSSPRVVQELFAVGENQTAEGIIERLSNKLLLDDVAARAHASEALEKILENLSTEQKIHTLQSLSGKIVDWLMVEIACTPALHTICTQLKDLAHILIRTRQFSDCYPIVHVFRLIISNQIQKKDEIRLVASAMLKEIASDEMLDILIEEIRTNKDNEQKEADRILTIMAELSLNRLLDILQNSDDSAERVLILNLIAEIGPAATQIIVDRIDSSAPWFYLRNLLRILGRIGKEEHALVLEPLLYHGDHRVQREALKGISNIGGSSRGTILIDVLAKCDDLFKASVVATLGSLKYRDAVHPLMELFKAKLSVPDEVKIDLQEKICLALGNIEDKAALPFLTEISKQMGFLGFRSYSPAVKTAAVKAIRRIMSKEEQQ
jgi:HEAT repeat protein